MKPLAWLLAAFMLVLLLLVSLPFTAVGTRVLAGWLDGLDAVALEYRGGRLLGELELARLQLDLGSVSVELVDLRTQMRPGCLWNSRFCLTRATLGAVTVRVHASPESAPSEPDALAAAVSVPYPIEVDALDATDIRVIWDGGQWAQQRLTAAVRLAGSELRVSAAVLDSPELYLDSAEDGGGGYAGFAPPALQLPLALVVQDAALRGARLRLGEQAVDLGAAELSARWQGSLLRVDNLAVQRPDWGSAELDGSLDFSQQWPVDARIALAPAPGRVPAPFDSRDWTLAAGGDLAALQLELLSAGEPGLRLHAELDVTAAELPFAGGAALDSTGSTPLGALFPGAAGTAGDLAISGPLRLMASGNLSEQAVTLTGAFTGLGYEQLSLSGEAVLALPHVTIGQLTLRDAVSDSAVSASGSAQLADAWQLALTVASDGLQLPQLSPLVSGRVGGDLAVSAGGGGGAWRVAVTDVAIKGEVNKLPARLSGHAGIDHQLQLLPGRLDAEVNGTRVELDTGEAGADAELSVALDSLGRWLPGAEGEIKVYARGDLEGGQVVLDGTVANLRFAGVETPAARLSGRWWGETQKLQADLSAAELTVDGPDLSLSNVDLAAEGSLQAHRLMLSSGGDLRGQLSISGRFVDGLWEGKLQPTSLATRGEQWRLAQPVALSWQRSAAVVQVAAHCWRHDEFDLCAERLLAGSEGDVALRLAGDVRAFNGILPRGLRIDGPLRAELAAHWDVQSPLEVSADALGERINVVRRYGMGEQVTVTWETSRLALRHSEGQTQIAASAGRDGRTVVDVEARLPAASGGTLAGRMVLDRLQLATLSPWVTELSTLRGELSGALDLGGTAADPVIDGRLSLAEGRVVAVGNPTELTDLSLTLALADNRGTLSGEGLLGGGRVTLAGEIVAQPTLRVSLEVQGSKHQVLVPPASELLVSETLQLEFTRELLDVAGSVRVHEGVLRHEELPAGGVAMSRDVVMVDVTGRVIREERPFEIRSDLVVRIDDGFRLEGEQVNATLAGDLQLVSEPGRPLQVFGTLRVLGGELNVYRQRLQIKRGSVAFSGPPDNPELDIAAEREIRADNVTVGARLYGRLEAPELEVYSSPVMSQSEAMSYLVRGRGLDSGAGADGTALALSIGADAVNQSGIVRELNRLPLISNVAFGASGEADETAATVSGYLGERIYLSYGIGIYEPINVLTARLYLQSRLWLEVVSRLENSLDLYYAFEIE